MSNIERSLKIKEESIKVKNTHLNNTTYNDQKEVKYKTSSNLNINLDKINSNRRDFNEKTQNEICNLENKSKGNNDIHNSGTFPQPLGSNNKENNKCNIENSIGIIDNNNNLRHNNNYNFNNQQKDINYANNSIENREINIKKNNLSNNSSFDKNSQKNNINPNNKINDNIQNTNNNTNNINNNVQINNSNNKIKNPANNVINNTNNKNIASNLINQINNKNIAQKIKDEDVEEINKINEIKNENNKNCIIESKEEKEKKEEKLEIIENYLCFKCQEKAFIQLNQKNFSIDMKCVNGHNIKNISIKDFILKNELNKNMICQECKNQNLKPEELYYCLCNKNICQKCKNGKVHKNHSQMNLQQKYNFCFKHKNEYKCFCLQCNKNGCYECLNEHNDHLEFLIDFENYMPKDKEIAENKNYLHKIKEYKYEFDLKFDQFINTLRSKKKDYDEKFDKFIEVQNNLINRIDKKKFLSYEDIDNFTNLKIIDNDKNKILLFLSTFEFVEEGRMIIDFLTGDDSEKNKKNKNKKNINNLNIQNNKKNELNQIKEYKEQKYYKSNNYNYSNNYKNRKIKIIDKIENCDRMSTKKEERCITCFAILRNNRIAISFKTGILKFYELIKNSILGIKKPFKSNAIELKELLRLEEEEYCFNYVIELFNGDVAVCSEDSTLKIIELYFDEQKSNKKYNIIQTINEKEQAPIYIIKELGNTNLVLGCWRNIIVYQKANEYELINKIIIDDYTFSLLELSPNVIISSHSNTKTLTIHNLNDYSIDTIKNIESNENNNIICKYNDKNDIVFVAFNKGINIVSVIKKCLIQIITLNEVITGLCPMMANLDVGNGKKEKIFTLLCGEKEQLYNQKINYMYNLTQIAFNFNDRDKGVIDSKDINRKIDYEIISKKNLIHFYDITNIQNTSFCKNNDSLKITNNKDEQWIFSSGNEDKTLNIWKIK